MKNINTEKTILSNDSASEESFTLHYVKDLHLFHVVEISNKLFQDCFNSIFKSIIE